MSRIIEGLEAVRGMQGHWHASRGDWHRDGDRLLALCKVGVSPRYRQEDLNLVNCPKCKELLKKC